MIQTGTCAPPVHFNILPAPGFIPDFLWDPCCSSFWFSVLCIFFVLLVLVLCIYLENIFLHCSIALLLAYILMIGYTFLQIIFNDIHIYLKLVRLLKAFSSITDMLLFCNCLLIVNRCLYSTNGLLLYFNDTYLNGVKSANSLNYL